MLRKLLKSKIHRAKVTGADLNYEGSIGIDPKLCKEADLKEFEKVDVYNISNGARFTTYVILGSDGEISLNGAAARLVQKDDLIIVANYAEYDEEEVNSHKPIILLMDEHNRIKEKL
ncbi:MAG: aspartate 1-decarboxylase [Ignavibacteria bacterium]|jgi:aspartate 1-decarboxylase